MTLTDFLLARIAEDEAVAQAATTDRWWSAREVRSALDIYDSYGNQSSDAVHIARHNPARVQAECEAKRRLVSARRDYMGDFPLRVLAVIYAAHPDYRDEWRA